MWSIPVVRVLTRLWPRWSTPPVFVMRCVEEVSDLRHKSQAPPVFPSTQDYNRPAQHHLHLPPVIEMFCYAHVSTPCSFCVSVSEKAVFNNLSGGLAMLVLCFTHQLADELWLSLLNIYISTTAKRENLLFFLLFFSGFYCLFHLLCLFKETGWTQIW